MTHMTQRIVTIQAIVQFAIDTEAARELAGIGDGLDDNAVALEVINGSEGAEFDNMAMIASVTDATVIDNTGTVA